jgi:hypothetical protein
LGEFGRVCASLGKCGRVWASLCKFSCSLILGHFASLASLAIVKNTMAPLNGYGIGRQLGWYFIGHTSNNINGLKEWVDGIIWLMDSVPKC